MLFKIREALWWIVAELEDVLYPYRDRLTPEERFEVRVKDPYSGEEYMVEEHIRGINDKINKLQDQMMDVQDKVAKHEQKLKIKVNLKKPSSSVSGSGW